MISLCIVPAKVTTVSATTLDTFTVLVAWLPPSHDTHSIITYYNISYMATDKDLLGDAITVNSSEHNVTLDIEEGVSYRVRVTAGNILGESQPVTICYNCSGIHIVKV